MVHWGVTQKIRITSGPPEADVIIDNVYRGKTPLLISVARHDDHEILIRKDGYQKYEAFTGRDLSYWIYGNLLVGVTAVGMLTDAMGGSMYNVKPDAIHAELIVE